jgi:hypothetical protein
VKIRFGVTTIPEPTGTLSERGLGLLARRPLQFEEVLARPTLGSHRIWLRRRADQLHGPDALLPPRSVSVPTFPSNGMAFLRDPTCRTNPNRHSSPWT